MSIDIRMRRVLAAATVALALGACTTPSSFPPGTSETEVVTKLGRPTLELDRPGGGRRLIYSGQPLGQFTWLTDIDTNGRVIGTTQALTSERFLMINDGLAEGRWNRDRLLLEFGPPAENTRVASAPDQDVWGYRFREDGVWNSLMYVYVDRATGVVRRFHPGPDPLAEPRMLMGQ